MGKQDTARKRYMRAYYYSFRETRCDPIDDILERVAWAGKGYHHTEYWADEVEAGMSYVDMIQKAADDAANGIAELEAALTASQADVVALREALAKLLTHPGIADMDPRDKDPEDHALEREAREARDAANPGRKIMAVVEAAREFVKSGTRLTMCVRGPCQQVVEHKDRSDPQSKLFEALDALGEG